jgi:hypothetical protein
MAHDVFISHSKRDRAVADAVRAALERRGLRCWNSPRTSRRGPEGAEEISRAIDECRAVVLLFSTNGAASLQVLGEVEQAIARDLPLVPVRIDEVAVSRVFSQYVSPDRWIEAIGSRREAGIDTLATSVASLLGRGASLPARRAPDARRPAEEDPARPAWYGLRVFICAKSEDYTEAGMLYEFFSARGIRAFFSPRSLPKLGAADFRRQIDDALESAVHLVVVTSSAANVRSKWVEAEWSMFLNEMRSGRKSGNVVTLLCGDCRAEDLPLSLRSQEALPFCPEAFEKLLSYVI